MSGASICQPRHVRLETRRPLFADARLVPEAATQICTKSVTIEVTPPPHFAGTPYATKHRPVHDRPVATRRVGLLRKRHLQDAQPGQACRRRHAVRPGVHGQPGVLAFAGVPDVGTLPPQSRGDDQYPHRAGLVPGTFHRYPHFRRPIEEGGICARLCGQVACSPGSGAGGIRLRPSQAGGRGLGMCSRYGIDDRIPRR